MVKEYHKEKYLIECQNRLILVIFVLVWILCIINSLPPLLSSSQKTPYFIHKVTERVQIQK